MAVTKEHLLSTLEANAVQNKYYIEYSNFLSNHLAHGAVALHDLGAPVEVFDTFVASYVKKLEPTDGEAYVKQEKKKDEVHRNTDDVDALKGKRTGYYELLQHYTRNLASTNNSLDEFVRTEFPKLAPGSFASALHPLIHAGYGYHVGDAATVLEGFAYMHHSYFPITFKRGRKPATLMGKGSKTVLEVVELLQQDDAIYEHMTSEATSKRAERYLPVKGPQIKYFVLAEDKGDDLLDYVSQIKLPDFKTIDELASFVVDQMIVLYQGLENRNDFFLLHAVTSSWSLKKLLRSGIPQEAAVDIIAQFLCAAFAFYLAQGRPRVLPDLLYGEDVSGLSWTDVTALAMKKDASTTDEHIYKLIQVCKDQSVEGKSTTPEMKDIYKRASLTALNSPLWFFRP